MGVECVVSANQERARTACRIANRDRREVAKAGVPIIEQLLGVLILAGLRVDLVLLGDCRESLLDQDVNGAFDDESGKRRRRVIDAEALPLGALGHFGKRCAFWAGFLGGLGVALGRLP